MNKKAGVSVVMIVRNGGRFISEAIASVRAQSRPADELIVVDGNSNDDTVLRARAAHAVVVQQPGTGIGDARNHGIKLAVSPYVAFLDHDDLWLADKLARQLDALHRQPSARFAISLVDMQPADTAVSVLHPNLRANARRGVVRGWTPSAFVAERTLFDEVGSFDEDLGVGTDMDFFARLIESRIPGALLDEVLVTKRLHSSNQSIDVRSNVADLMTVVKRSIVRRKQSDPRK